MSFLPYRLPRRPAPWVLRRCLVVVLFLLAVLSIGQRPVLRASDPVTAGYRDFSFSTTDNDTPTGEKPESKLWWNDGFWWGSLFNPTAKEHRIYRLDPALNDWVDTGTTLDPRLNTKASALWDGHKLYVVSHRFTKDGAALTTTSLWGRLYRYSYDPATKSYSRDAGFPVNVTRGKCETLTLAKDATGKLWVTYAEDLQILVNHSTGDDLVWGTPYLLPASSAAVNVEGDDISAIVAFPRRKIGVMWSNQLTAKIYFAVHQDDDPDTVWQPEEVALPGPGDPAGAWADDHINLKTMQADGSGRVFAAIKTSRTASNEPLVMVLERNQAASWSEYVVGRVRDNHTRPILLLDEENGRIYVFATKGQTGGSIYYKSADIGNIQFPTGVGTPFILSSTDTTINNATSTAQNVNSATGLVVLASDQNTHFYLHNLISIPANLSLPRIDSFSPPSGGAGTVVTLTGSVLTGVTAVTFNGAPAASFAIDSDTQIHATVPAGATTGRISVSSGTYSSWSAAEFNVVDLPVVSSFTPTSGPPGTEVAVSGSGFTGVTQVTFNGAPGSFVVDTASSLRATVPAGAATGPIAVTNPAGTGSSLDNFVVTAAPVVLSFNPSDDTDVNDGSPTKTDGASTTFRARGPSPTYRAYLKFNVSGVVGAVQSAKLRLRVVDPSSDGGTVYVTDNNYAGTGTPWTEGGLTWNNAPALGASLGVAGAVLTGAWVEIDVTPAVPGDGTWSFGLASASTNSVYYSSKEGADPPVLAITVNADVPKIDSFSPGSGVAGTEVTLSGSKLSHVTAVTFNGTPAGAFTIDSDTQIRATVPVGAATGRISVSDGTTTTWSASDFVVFVTPVVSSFTPEFGPEGTEVTVSGNGFTGVSAAAVNGSPAAFTFDSDAQVRVTVPVGASSGPISVTNPAGTGSSAASFLVTGPPVTFNPSDDTDVNSGNPTKTDGGATTLRARSPSPEYRAYLKFGVSGLTGTVKSAKLRLWVADPSDVGGLLFLVDNNFAGTGTPWTEGALSWNNAPAPGATPLASLGSVALNTWVEFDVTTAIAGDGTYSFALTSTSTNSVYYSSKEGANPPQLVVTETVP